jgi:quercetin dioxygenase-like cupin family protein
MLEAAVMAEPITPERGACFDLAAIARDMRESEAYRQTGHTARTIVREPDLRIVLVVMRAGSAIKEHKADDTTSVQALMGRMDLRLPDRVAALPAGALVVLERGLPHSVEAHEDSTFLLTLGGRPAR